uniref:Reticulocyte-binding protein 2 like protein a n=1 Tax=Columba livia TaxID=8932 RepID=R7VWY7_COLLI
MALCNQLDCAPHPWLGSAMMARGPRQAARGPAFWCCCEPPNSEEKKNWRLKKKGKEEWDAQGLKLAEEMCIIQVKQDVPSEDGSYTGALLTASSHPTENSLLKGFIQFNGRPYDYSLLSIMENDGQCLMSQGDYKLPDLSDTESVSSEAQQQVLPPASTMAVESKTLSYCGQTEDCNDGHTMITQPVLSPGVLRSLLMGLAHIFMKQRKDSSEKRREEKRREEKRREEKRREEKRREEKRREEKRREEKRREEKRREEKRREEKRREEKRREEKRREEKRREEKRREEKRREEKRREEKRREEKRREEKRREEKRREEKRREEKRREEKRREEKRREEKRREEKRREEKRREEKRSEAKRSEAKRREEKRREEKRREEKRREEETLYVSRNFCQSSN